MNNWKYYASGEYNNVYVSQDKTLVFKRPKHNDGTDLQERAVRLWNEINPDMRAYIEDEGWVCPFIKGDDATDEEASEELVNIYNKTGRILLDAVVPGNIIKTPDDRLVCVDIGLALQLHEKTKAQLGDICLTRAESRVSLELWKATHLQWRDFLNDIGPDRIKTADMTRALLFIQAHRPDIYDASFLLNKPDLVTQLSQAYIAEVYVTIDDESSLANKVVSFAMNSLQEERSIIPEHVQDSCVHEIQQFIDLHSDGQARVTDSSTESFSKAIADFKNVTTAKEIVKILEENYSQFVDIENSIDEVMSEHDFDSYEATERLSDLDYSVSKCDLILENSEELQCRYTIMTSSKKA
jgi:hypothetical protein